MGEAKDFIWKHPLNFSVFYGQGWGVGIMAAESGVAEIPECPSAEELGLEEGEAYRAMRQGYQDGFEDGLKYRREKR